MYICVIYIYIHTYIFIYIYIRIYVYINVYIYICVLPLCCIFCHDFHKVFVCEIVYANAGEIEGRKAERERKRVRACVCVGVRVCSVNMCVCVCVRMCVDVYLEMRHSSSRLAMLYACAVHIALKCV